MSNNNVVSQAAALAAFNGINKKDDSVFNIPSKSASSINISRTGNTSNRGSRPYSVSQIPKIQFDKLAIYSEKKNTSSPSTPGKCAILRSPNEESLKTQARNRDSYSGPHSLGNEYFDYSKTLSDSSKITVGARTPVNTSAKDMINNVKSSIESLTTPVDTSRRRISAQYEPQEMLKNVRNSINSKAKSSQSVELTTKNQAMLNAIRDSIDSKKVINSVNDSSIALNAFDELKKQSDNDEQITSTSENKKLNSDNYSISSLGSAFSEMTMTKENIISPIIVGHDVDKRRIKSRYMDNDVYDNELCNSHSSIGNYEFSANDNDLSSEYVDSVKIGPVYTEFSPVSTTSISIESTNEELILQKTEHDPSGNENLIDESQKTKLKRKPPPSIDDKDQFLFDSISNLPNENRDANISSDDISMHSFHTDKSNYDTDDNMDRREGGDYFTTGQVTRKLPQFPDLNDKSKSEKNPLFRRYSKLKSNERIPFSTYSEDEPIMESKVYQEPVSISRSSTPHLHQPVQLKATMRKSNKKKEKKMIFNEYKPWKNHVELSHITDQERKRYEGVWASNKGSYIESVVTKLVGVDYNSDKCEDVPNDEQEISRKAALLSANASKLDTSKLTDHLKFHNIESADITQLLHGILVKRIWQRSKLPNETLESIWNLVDFRKDGTLNKPEFLVGMWLIDQCLYGRKLPKKVDDVVWDSLGNIGVNVVIKKSSRR